MMSFTNMGNQLALVTENACIAPRWQEMLEQHAQQQAAATKRASTSDYVPQRIMDPTDMLELEKQFAADDAKERSAAPERQQSRTELDPGDFGLSYMNGAHPQARARSRTSSILSGMSGRTHAFADDASLASVSVSAAHTSSAGGGADASSTFGSLGPAPPSAYNAS